MKVESRENLLMKVESREDLLVKAERVKHLRNDMSVVSLGMVAQMLNPYGCYLYG